MKTTEGNIEIKRNEGKLSSISVIMPTWRKQEHDSIISINVPLLGLKTIAKDFDDADKAIEEAIRCFCIAAEKFGQGFEAELQTLGWEVSKGEKDESLLTFGIESGNLVFEQIMETGEQFAEKDLAIA